MRDSRFAIGRFIVLALMLGHWVSTSPSFSPRDIVDSPSLDRLETQSVIVSYRSSAVAYIKQSRADRLSPTACDATSVDLATVLKDGRLGLTVAGRRERIIASIIPAYCARAPPTT